MPGDKTEILPGTLDLIVSKTFASMGPSHGYGIARGIEQISGTALQINRGTIYTSMVRLIQKRWISGAWGTLDNNRKAKSYSMTKTGRKQLHVQAEKLEADFNRGRPRAAPGGPWIILMKTLARYCAAAWSKKEASRC